MELNRQAQWLIGLAAATLLAVPAHTQAPPAPKETITYTSAADIATMMAKAEATRGSAPIGGGAVLNLAPYTANLEYRMAPGNAAVHETDAELFFVVEGSGVLVTGGKLAADARRTGTNLSASASEGGSERRIGKGDVFIVPENTPHWFKSVDGKLAMISLHVPRAAAAK